MDHLSNVFEVDRLPTNKISDVLIVYRSKAQFAIAYYRYIVGINSNRICGAYDAVYMYFDRTHDTASRLLLQVF